MYRCPFCRQVVQPTYHKGNPMSGSMFRYDQMGCPRCLKWNTPDRWAAATLAGKFIELSDQAIAELLDKAYGAKAPLPDKCCIVDCDNAPAYTVAPSGKLGLFNHVCAGHLAEYLNGFTLLHRLYSTERWYVQVYAGPDAEIGPEPVLK